MQLNGGYIVSILDDTIAAMKKKIDDAKAVPAVAALIVQRAELFKQAQELTQQINKALGPDVLEAEEALPALERQQNRQNRK